MRVSSNLYIGEIAAGISSGRPSKNYIVNDKKFYCIVA
jgi:hypothetical protein